MIDDIIRNGLMQTRAAGLLVIRRILPGLKKALESSGSKASPDPGNQL
jgi:hypothetical protein